jgi:lysophospholipase L1-like esterase
VRPSKALTHTALLLSGVLGGAVIAEGALRLYSRLASGYVAQELRRRDPTRVLIEPHGDLAYRQKPHSEFRYPNGTSAHSNALGFRGPDVARRKPPGTFRIVLLGGSTTHGWGVNDDQTIDWYLRRALAEAHPRLRVEVLNLAFDGYDSYQDWARLRSDGLAFDPDVIIVNSGINDVRNTRIPDLADPDPRAAMWTAELSRLREEERRGGPSWWTRLQHRSYVARFPGIARDALHVSRAVAAGRTTVPNDAALDYFERNLTRIGRLAAKRGIPVLFSRPPSALTSYDARATSLLSYWVRDAATTQHYRELLAERMERVATALQAEHRSARYVAHGIDVGLFIDDAHLTPQGNCALALAFVADLRLFPSIRERLGRATAPSNVARMTARTHTGDAACPPAPRTQGRTADRRARESGHRSPITPSRAER